MSKAAILDGADHPVVFILFVSLAVAGMLSVLAWLAKAADMPGVATALKP